MYKYKLAAQLIQEQIFHANIEMDTFFKKKLGHVND